ncbi:MAG: EamA family transporter [Nocardiopsaceae bacterium]|jgi:drug/metabolite transporter (DMT)-like permease|nr:EamA family transporter [Nocardiopsaceae bacterium]
MSPAAIALVLVAAVAHASWNLFSKQAAETGAAFFLWLLAVCGSAIYLPVVIITAIVTRPHLTGLNWLFLAGTGLLHSGYFLFLQHGYRIGDLSLAYPIGRGTGALLAALAGIVLLGERPTLTGYAGILAIVTGVVLIGLPERGAVRARAEFTTAEPLRAEPLRAHDGPLRTEPRRQSGRGVGSATTAAIGFALVTGLFIGGYTIWDKYAVSTLHTQPVLQGYAGLPVMAAVFTPFVLRDRTRLAEVWRSFRPQALGAATLSPLAYMLVLGALSFTAVSAVAPAREVSVLFGVLLGGRLLGEASLARRLAAAAVIVAGIIAIAVG